MDHQMTAIFEWDGDLGPRWLNKDNLMTLLKLKGNGSEIYRVDSVSFPDSSVKERAEEELQQLNQRMDTLDKMPYGKLMALDKAAGQLLEDQYQAMIAYRKALQARIKAWTD